MRSCLELPASAAEGSFVGDVLGAVAAELAGIYSVELAGVLDNAFVSTASGDALTRLCQNYGVDRAAAAKAKVLLTITGTAGARFSGVKAYADGLVFELEDGEIGADGTAIVFAHAQEEGAAYNVAAGTVDELFMEYSGITGVTNALAAYGGADAETDDSLRARTLVKMRTPSSGGNETDYVLWALTVPGVTHAAVSTDPPNVNVYIIKEGMEQADSALINSVKDKINALRPVGAVVSVASGTAVPITVEVTASIGSADANAVKAAMEKNIRRYFEETAFSGAGVSYLKMAELLFVDGVLDVAGYKLNNAAESVALSGAQFPMLSEVVLNV